MKDRRGAPGASAAGSDEGAALLRDAATGHDPFGAYDRLRPLSPLRTGRRSWFLLGYHQVRAAMADPGRFSSDVRDSDNPVFRDSPLVFDDPPRHTRLRRLVGAAFTPSRVAAMEPAVRALAEELFSAMGEGPADVIEAVADPLPVVVIATMLGVPVERHREFKQWSHDRSHVVYHSRGSRTPELEAAEAGVSAQEAYLRDLAVARRAEPGDDLISALATAQVDGERLTIDDVAGTCSVLLSAGNLTTTRLLGSLVAELAAHPDRLAAMREDLAAIGPFVEEVLRAESPVQTPIRRTTSDVELGGRVIPAGAFVTLGVGAANRDPAGADQPHLAFGHGIHYCLGAALARLEARVTLEVLCARARRVELAGPPEQEVGLAHRGFVRLPIRLVP